MRAAFRSLVLFLLIPAAFAHEVTTPVIAPSVHAPDSILAASNGRTFLTVWMANGHLYGSAADGTSEPPLPVTIRAKSARPASLIAAEDDYVVALSTSKGGVQLVRMDDRGRVLSVAQPDLPPLYSPRLAWNGQHLLLIGAEGQPGYPDYLPLPRIRAYLLTRDGVLHRVIGTVASGMTVAAAADRGDYTVAIGNREGVRLYRIGTGGEVGNDFVQVYVMEKLDEFWPWSIQLFVRGATTAVGWVVQNVGSSMKLAIIKSGAVAHREVHLPASMRLVATTTGYVGATQFGDDVRLLYFDAEGKRLAGDRRVPRAQLAAIASAGDVIEIVYTAGAKVLAAWLPNDSSAPPVMTALLSKGPTHQSVPVVASDGIEFFTAFAEYTAVTSAARYARFTRNGHGLDGAGRPFGGLLDRGPNVAAAAFGAGRYLLVWEDSPSAGTARLHAAFVGADGSIGEPVFAREDAAAPAVIWNGSNFFLVWSQYGLTGRVFGVTISASGDVSAPRRISPDPVTGHEDHGVVDVAWNGREYLVAWLVNDFRGFICSACLPPLDAGVHAIRVSADGVPRASTAMKIVPLSRVDLPVSGVHVAAAGQQFLVLIDRFERVDASLVHALGFEAPRPFFQWLPIDWYREIGVVSDVTPDRDGYLTTVRFGDGERSWILTRRLSAWATSTDEPRGIEVGLPDWSWPRALATVSNAAGDTAIVGSESAQPGDMPRIHAHFVSEMPAAPAPPPEPRNVTAKIAGNQTTISWEASEGAEGYVIEIPWPTWIQKLTMIPAGMTTYTAHSAIHKPLRVRAYNGGGASTASEIVPVDVTRHRSARR